MAAAAAAAAVVVVVVVMVVVVEMNAPRRLRASIPYIDRLSSCPTVAGPSLDEMAKFSPARGWRRRHSMLAKVAPITLLAGRSFGRKSWFSLTILTGKIKFGLWGNVMLYSSSVDSAVRHSLDAAL